MFKPLQAAGMSADNVRIWVIVRKMNIWQFLSQEHEKQKARRGFVSFITLLVFFCFAQTANLNEFFLLSRAAFEISFFISLSLDLTKLVGFSPE